MIWRIGAIRGRHPLPATEFLLDKPHLKVDGDLVLKTRERVRELFDQGMRECEFYTTGLSQVNVEAVAEMERLGIKVYIHHWDSKTKQYYHVPRELQTV